MNARGAVGRKATKVERTKRGF